jgi:predicted dehydrogenase
LAVAIPSAEAGCALLLEKPISHSMAGVDKLYAAVQKSGVKVLVGFQFRYHPGLQRARQLIADGEIGRIVSAHVTFGEYLPGWHPWEDYRNGYAARADMGGGVVLTQCHSLDYLPWLVGKGVKAVWGFTGKISDLDVNVEDTAKIGLRFVDGALGSLHLDFNRQPPVHTFEITGTKGSIKWNLTDGTPQLFRAGAEDTWESYPIPVGWERNEMFLDQMKHFVAVVQDNTQPACPLEDGIRVQELIQAVYESNTSGKVKVLQP